MKNKYGFILVKPQLGENIGACARSMKNFGFSKLYIVKPKFSFPNHKAKVTSVGAYDIIGKAKVFDKIENALNPFNLVISLSARRRDINKKHITIKDLFNFCDEKNINIKKVVGVNEDQTSLINKSNLEIKNLFSKLGIFLIG